LKPRLRGWRRPPACAGGVWHPWRGRPGRRPSRHDLGRCALTRAILEPLYHTKATTEVSPDSQRLKPRLRGWRRPPACAGGVWRPRRGTPGRRPSRRDLGPCARELPRCVHGEERSYMGGQSAAVWHPV